MGKIIPYIICTLVFTVSYILVWFTDIELLSIFDTLALFTYFGVLIGFSITVYTFGLSMISDIKSNIQGLESKTSDEKKEIFKKLKNGFSQIKQDIWLIFVGIILITLSALLNSILEPFEISFQLNNISDALNLTMFILSTLAMFDILRTMFNLSEINIELLPNN